jgi:hypothetical protein
MSPNIYIYNSLKLRFVAFYIWGLIYIYIYIYESIYIYMSLELRFVSFSFIGSRKREERKMCETGSHRTSTSAQTRFIH